jgi:hypothetical protein
MLSVVFDTILSLSVFKVFKSISNVSIDFIMLSTSLFSDLIILDDDDNNNGGNDDNVVIIMIL